MEFIRKVRENLKDPKKKALTQLGIYFVFFVFVFILLKSGGSSTPPVEVEEPLSSLEKYNNMQSYTYKVTYTNIDKIDIIDGTYYDNKTLFNYNNLKYYFEDYLYIIDNDSYYLSNIEYNISKIFNKNLYNIINELEEESKTTYKDGTVVTNYIIDSNKLYNYLYELESAYTNLSSVSITEKDDIITNIVLDLTNLNMYLNKIEIEYNNIDYIESLDFNKENYIYKE